jgi:hypothetical protein
MTKLMLVPFLLLHIFLIVSVNTQAQTRKIDLYIMAVEDNFTGETVSNSIDWPMKITSKKLFIGKNNQVSYTFTSPSNISWSGSWCYATDDQAGVDCKIAFMAIDSYSRKIIIQHADLTITYFGTEE